VLYMFFLIKPPKNLNLLLYQQLKKALVKIETNGIFKGNPRDSGKDSSSKIRTDRFYILLKINFKKYHKYKLHLRAAKNKSFQDFSLYPSNINTNIFPQ